MAAHIEVARREAAEQAGVNLMAVSIFVGGPNARVINLSPPERAGLRALIAATGVRVIAHSAYNASPWRGDPDAARYIREELGVCHEAGIAGLVVHLPKLPRAQVMRYIARLFNPDAGDVRVYLETPAVKARESYYETPEKLAALFRDIRQDLDPELRHFGLCIDTAHLWVSAVDLASYAAADGWLRDLEAVADVIPPQAIMIHLNDSQRALGVGPDAHAALLRGKMWGPFLENPTASGLAAFTDYAQRHDTPLILERKPKELLISDYRILRDLVPGAAL
jgi:endonuclease IV